MNLKLGKKPFEPSPHDFKLKQLELVELPKPKRNFGHGGLFPDGEQGWRVLGNDNAGDCVWAGAGHETMLYNKLMRHIVSFTSKNALDDYAAVTGYNPDTGDNDNGTNVRDAMSYRRKTGVVDALGQRHRIDAYISIDPKDWDAMISCVWTFGAVGIGFEFPNSAWKQFYSGQPWDVVTGASIDGGHYVPVFGSTDPAKKATVITWAKRQELTREFYEEYNDEAWVPLSKESMSKSGFNYRHLDWTKLNDMLNTL